MAFELVDLDQDLAPRGYVNNLAVYSHKLLKDVADFETSNPVFGPDEFSWFVTNLEKDVLNLWDGWDISGCVSMHREPTVESLE